METREQLLNGLHYVREQISKIIAVSERQIQLVSSFREQEAKLAEIEKIPTKGKNAKAMVFFLALAFVQALLIALVQDWGNFVFALVCIYIIFESWNKKSVLKNISILFWVITIVRCYGNILKAVFAGDILLGVSFAVLTVISVCCVKGFVKASNKYIDHENEKISHKNKVIEQQNAGVREHNAQIKRKYEETVETLNWQKAELYKNTAKWFPRDYYSLEAVDFFIRAVENYKCDTMKELVLLFDDTQYKNQMLASQQELIKLNKQQILNQEKMVRHMRVANVLNMANVALNYQTLNAVRDNTAAVHNVASAVNNNTSSVNRVADVAGRIHNILKKW